MKTKLANKRLVTEHWYVKLCHYTTTDLGLRSVCKSQKFVNWFAGVRKFEKCSSSIMDSDGLKWNFCRSSSSVDVFDMFSVWPLHSLRVTSHWTYTAIDAYQWGCMQSSFTVFVFVWRIVFCFVWLAWWYCGFVCVHVRVLPFPLWYNKSCMVCKLCLPLHPKLWWET